MTEKAHLKKKSKNLEAPSTIVMYKGRAHTEEGVDQILRGDVQLSRNMAGFQAAYKGAERIKFDQLQKFAYTRNGGDLAANFPM